MIFDTRTLVRGLTESQEAFNKKIYNMVDNNLKDILAVKKKRTGSKWLDIIEDYETSHDYDYIFKPRDGEDYSSHSFNDRVSNFLKFKQIAMNQRDDEIIDSIKKKKDNENLHSWLIRANDILTTNHSIINEPRVEFGETYAETEARITRFRDARDEIKVQIRTAQDKAKYNDSIALSKKKEEDKIALRKQEREDQLAAEKQEEQDRNNEEEQEKIDEEDRKKYKAFILIILSIIVLVSFKTYSNWNIKIMFWSLVGISLMLVGNLLRPTVYERINSGMVYRWMMKIMVYFALAIKHISK